MIKASFHYLFLALFPYWSENSLRMILFDGHGDLTLKKLYKAVSHITNWRNKGNGKIERKKTGCSIIYYKW